MEFPPVNRPPSAAPLDAQNASMGTPLSPLEERIWRAGYRYLGPKPGANGSAAGEPGSTEWFRGRIRQAAYHEAGHVVVDAFFGYPFEDLRYLSIMPRGVSYGRVMAGYLHDPRYAISLGRPAVWGRLLMCLGGWCADQRSRANGVGAAGYLADRTQEMRGVPELWDMDNDAPHPNTDEAHVWDLVATLTSRTRPFDRIVRQAVAWTFGIFDTPEVWQCVERGAAELGTRGTIRWGHRMHAIFTAGMVVKASEQRKWKRRLLPPSRTQP